LFNADVPHILLIGLNSRLAISCSSIISTQNHSFLCTQFQEVSMTLTI
jgi:hypothetical protein